jgi:hypothetical protein
MSLSTQKSALEAYLSYLNLKGIESEVIHQRMAFVTVMASHLNQKPKTREAYAETLNLLVQHSKQSLWLYDVTVAREFYPFWMEDIKAIARLSDSVGFDVQSIQWRPLPTTLKMLSLMLERELFSEQESLLLERYLHCLHQQGLARHVLLVQLKLAKIMLLRLRDAPVHNNLV